MQLFRPGRRAKWPRKAMRRGTSNLRNDAGSEAKKCFTLPKETKSGLAPSQIQPGILAPDAGGRAEEAISVAICALSRSAKHFHCTGFNHRVF